ncbi:YtxH domain-containing protein [Agreia sp. PsM10]|uniref:YtxH domain-containing protein n=1 Tax=Agreia sp. PsM10 TaxID=3030533 RepID=UPI00263A8998|nr:YtxH domain-containing protein [Agreia sp. PsM10]MDN4641548.1 YtxH domain-containing protein [Agreia sp. PsM10]
MAARLIFGLGVGLAAGYVLGTKAGRAKYTELKARASDVWHDPHVQKAVSDAGDLVREAAPVVQEKLVDVAKAAKDKVTGSSSADTSPSTSSPSSAQAND